MINNSIIGKRFGKLVVLSHSHTNQKTQSFWNCLCDCGNTKVIRRINLTGQVGSRSCGCLRQEAKAKISAAQKGIPRYKLKQGEGGLKQLYAVYRAQARKEDREFSLTIEEFHKIASSNCSYCGLPPQQVTKYYNPQVTEETRKKSEFIHNGIDRLDNSKGYALNNAVACCKICNKAKSNMNFEEFKEWLLRAGDHIVAIFRVREPS